MWEYCRVPCKKRKGFENDPSYNYMDELNRLGKDGWELCAAENCDTGPIAFIMKRQIKG